MKIQLLEPEGFPPAAAGRLGELGTVVGPEASDTQDVEVVFTRLASVLDAQFHARYPALRWIVSPTTGLNHIDVDHFEANGVEVISLRDRTEFLDTIHATAEHTIALALALIRNIPSGFDAVRQGLWDRYPHKGTELHGKTVLIHGYGRIGRMVAPIYRAFGCNVVAHDVEPGRVPSELSCDLHAILPETDLLSIHLPLNSDTQGIVGEDLLSRLPAHAVIINTSRGEIVDQDYLLRALETGAIAGAALDVLAHEPDPISPEIKARIAALGCRILVTPHIGGFTRESLESVENYITRLLINAVHAKR